MADTPNVQGFIDAQVVVVDSMLLNAYGTVHKMAVKYISFQDLSYELSATEEMLSAKNLVSNLWSVLDYCCIILHYKFRGTPTPSKARGISFPCDCKKSIFRESAVEWERKKIDGLLSDGAYERIGGFENVFSSIQLQEGAVPWETLTFYQLHFLRNTLTHNTINIHQERSSHRLEIFQHCNIGTTETHAAMTIRVPREPWNKANLSSETVPLLDVLFRACKVVEDRRDKLMHTIGERKFSDKYAFNLTNEHLIVTLNAIDPREYRVRYNQLHLECYGIEAELKDELQQLRQYENYSSVEEAEEAS